MFKFCSYIFHELCSVYRHRIFLYLLTCNDSSFLRFFSVVWNIIPDSFRLWPDTLISTLSANGFFLCFLIIYLKFIFIQNIINFVLNYLKFCDMKICQVQLFSCNEFVSTEKSFSRFSSSSIISSFRNKSSLVDWEVSVFEV